MRHSRGRMGALEAVIRFFVLSRVTGGAEKNTTKKQKEA